MRDEVELPADFLAGLLMQAASATRKTPAPAPPQTPTHGDKLPPKIYAVMAVTSLLTFATLATGYQLLVPHQSMFA